MARRAAVVGGVEVTGLVDGARVVHRRDWLADDARGLRAGGLRAGGSGERPEQR